MTGTYAAAGQSKKENRVLQPEKEKIAMKRYLSVLLLAAGFGMMCAGLARGEAMTVLKKAIVLCMECIGIG